MTSLQQNNINLNVGTSLRRDHRLSLRIIEVRFANPNSEIDVFAVTRISYLGSSSPSHSDGHANSFKDHHSSITMTSPSHHGKSGLRKLSLLHSNINSLSSNNTSLSKRYPTSTVLIGKTVTFKTRDSAFIDHNFDVDLLADVHHIEVELYHKRMLKDSLLGSAIILPENLVTTKPLEKWFPIRATSAITPSLPPSPTIEPNQSLLSLRATHPDGSMNTNPTYVPPSTAKVSDSESTGISIRIRLTYRNEYILPLTVYKPLVAVLMDPKMSVVSCLERSVDQDRDDVARTLVSVMHSMDMHEPLLIGMATREIQATSSPTLLFRANSVASKSLDHFLKLVGRPMLDSILRPVIKTIMAENKSCELDASRIDPYNSACLLQASGLSGSSTSISGSDRTTTTRPIDQVLRENQSNLEHYILWTIERIVAGCSECPSTLRNVFTAMRSAASIKWPHELDVSYVVVSSFLFLRMFNAAILGPKLFKLCDTFPNPTVARTLTLISKSLQQVANGCVFDGAKEPYMTALNPFLESMFPKVRHYLELMSTPLNPVSPRKASLDPVSAQDSSNSMNPTIASSVSNGSSGKGSSSTGSRKGLVKKLFGSGNIQTRDIGAGFGFGSTDTNISQTSPEAVSNCDIERDFADLYRVLTRIIETMRKNASPSEASNVNRLAIILKDLSTIKVRRMTSVPSAALVEAISQTRDTLGLRRMSMHPTCTRRQSDCNMEPYSLNWTSGMTSSPAMNGFNPPLRHSQVREHLVNNLSLGGSSDLAPFIIPSLQVHEQGDKFEPGFSSLNELNIGHQFLPSHSSGFHAASPKSDYKKENGALHSSQVLSNPVPHQHTYTPSIITPNHSRCLVPPRTHEMDDTP